LRKNAIGFPLVIPANAGIQGAGMRPPHLDTRFRGYDGVEYSRSPTTETFQAKPIPEDSVIPSQLAGFPSKAEAQGLAGKAGSGRG
jgi:hypothetical protein